MTPTQHSERLGPTAGFSWLKNALTAVRHRAARLFLIVFFYTATLGLLMLIPAAGPVLAALFMPFGTVLIGYATREAIADRMPDFFPLARAFSDKVLRTDLMSTGLVYAFVLITAQALYGYLAEPYWAQWQTQANDRLVWESVFEHFPWMPLGVASIIYIPGVMATWFSPLLCADKGMNWKKALFYSFFGCITNILPILVLGFLLVLGVTGIFFVAGQLVDLLGLHSINMFIFFPLSCLVLTVIYATYWPMYEALFGGTRGKDSLKEEKSL